MKKLLLLFVSITVAISLIILCALPGAAIVADGEIFLEISSYDTDDPGSPAYQICIPNGMGSETGLSVFPPKLQEDGSKDNWLAASRPEMTVRVGEYTKDAEGDYTSVNTETGDYYIRKSDNCLILSAGSYSDKLSYDVEVADYTLTGGELVQKIEAAKLVLDPMYASFRAYVYGSGSDVYQLEDTPQRQLEIESGITKEITSITVIAEVRAISGGAKPSAQTKIVTNTKKYNGDAVSLVDDGLDTTIETVYTENPQTGLAWTWAEIDDLQAGTTLKNAECSFVYVLVELVVHSQTFYPIDPVDVTPDDATTWDDCDVSSHIPSGATGVVIHLDNVNSSGGGCDVGLRKNGSTDGRTDYLPNYYHCWAAIGVDANRVFETYLENLTDINVWLVAYTVSGATFNTNAVDKTTGTTSAWTDVDCSSEAPNATGLIFEVQCKSNGSYFGFRKNGSSDDRTRYGVSHSSFGAIIGCDESQICEQYTDSTSHHNWLVGYVTDGCTFNTDATDVSLSSTGSWLDLSALPSGANMGFIEVHVTSTSYYYGLRENGSSENIYHRAYNHCWGFVECDGSQLIEGKINNVALDFFVVGYATEESAPTVDISNTPSSIAYGVVAANSTYWASGSEPSWPLTDGDAYFTLTNNTTSNINVDFRATNFTGGNGWTLTTGSPGLNTVRITVFIEGDGSGDGVPLTVSDQELITNMTASSDTDWELKLETGSFNDGDQKTSTITVTGSIP